MTSLTVPIVSYAMTTDGDTQVTTPRNFDEPFGGDIDAVGNDPYGFRSRFIY